MEEDDMVKSRVGNTLVRRRTDEEDKRAASLRDLKRRCQGLAEGWSWQPPKDPSQKQQRDHNHRICRKYKFGYHRPCFQYTYFQPTYFQPTYFQSAYTRA